MQALIFLPATFAECKGSISISEYDALYSLFNSTAGWNWVWESGYGQPWVFETNEIESNYLSQPCTQPWQGLICGGLTADSSCYIQQINLNDFNLEGQLPSQLEDLKQLEVLALGSNKLFGSLPESIGQLQYLESLDLDTNILTGTIPASYSKLTVCLR